MGEVNVVTVPVSEEENLPEGHNERMTQKADAGTNAGGTNNPNQGENLLAGKYKDRQELLRGISNLQYKDLSDDDLVQMYQKLESGGSEDNSQEDSGDTENESHSKEDDSKKKETDDNPFKQDSDSTDESTNDDEGDDDDEGAEEVPYDDVMEDLVESNELKPETREKLKQLGMSDEDIEDKLDAIRYRLNRTYEYAGGKDRYFKMLRFMTENWDEDKISAYDEAVMSGDQKRINMAIDTLSASFKEHRGNPSKKRIQPGGGGKETQTDGFKSTAEVKKAMADPRYRTDPAYRKDVYRRLKSSNI